MKKLKLLIILAVFSSCSPKAYTDRIFFDCRDRQGQSLNSDKSILIFQALHKSVVEDKDVADYKLIKDKRKIYVLNKWYSSFFGPTKDEVKEYPLSADDVPSRISDVEFCLKSEQELQEIADKTSAFMYLSFGDIEITGDIAKVGIATGWKGKSDSKTVYLSGGGYVLQYKKINGDWVFEKVLRSWMI